MITVPIVAAVLLAVVFLTVVVIMIVVCKSRKMESGAAYISTVNEYEMHPTVTSPDIEKPKLSDDVSFEPSTKFDLEKRVNVGEGEAPCSTKNEASGFGMKENVAYGEVPQKSINMSTNEAYGAFPGMAEY